MVTELIGRSLHRHVACSLRVLTSAKELTKSSRRVNENSGGYALAPTLAAKLKLVQRKVGTSCEKPHFLPFLLICFLSNFAILVSNFFLFGLFPSNVRLKPRDSQEETFSRFTRGSALPPWLKLRLAPPPERPPPTHPSINPLPVVNLIIHLFCLCFLFFPSV